MTDLDSRQRESLPRWRELVTTLDVGALVETFLAKLPSISGYRTGAVREDDLRAAARDSLALILSASAADSTTRSSSFPGELGRVRARQGVSGDDLVAAVRLDFQVIWSAMLTQAEAHGDMSVLALHAERLWWVIDDYARAVQQSYLEERAVMAAAARDTQQTYLAELFGPDGRAPGKVRTIARALDVDPDAVFRVVVADPAAADRVDRAAAHLTTAGQRVFVLNRPGRVTVLWPAGPGRDPHLAELGDLTGGYVPAAAGLGAVPAAAETAYEILRVLREPGLVTLREAWARVTKSTLDERHGFSAAVLGGLDPLAPADRELVIEAVRTYLATGSVSGTAELLYCHRNTVLNRLGRFRKLTGIDVTVPAQAALAVVTLA
ncbi:PucR family transcriptional regulator [Amycolatopsis jejuensis]|uniref:PucR family transcriptional regulator n=1 Tax=Amycolatopsis jejuensis TaxID=330084 RepID=UPI000525682F|nr:PucR family transcriptional regulator [Amycolatopsis jejuensis]